LLEAEIFVCEVTEMMERFAVVYLKVHLCFSNSKFFNNMPKKWLDLPHV